MTEFSIWIFLGVAVSIAITSVARSMHVIECAGKNATMSGFWSMIIMVTQSLAFFSLTKDPVYIIAVGIGAWIGAQGAVTYRYSLTRKRKLGNKMVTYKMREDDPK